MAHAINRYSGACKNIHGHSYKLEVTITSEEDDKSFIPAPGFILDFRELKKRVTSAIIEKFDHKLVLSEDYLAKNPGVRSQENLVILEAEPTAENLLIYFRLSLERVLPKSANLVALKLYETNDSYAEWVNT